jgi:hypothetical protein
VEKQQLQHELVSFDQRLCNLDDRRSRLDFDRAGRDAHALAPELCIVENMLFRSQVLRRCRQPRRSGNQVAIGPQHLIVDPVFGIDAQFVVALANSGGLLAHRRTAKMAGNRKHRVE